MRQVTINEKGITLLVLIITIVVMVILLGITYNFTLGDNGILLKANKISFLEDISDLQKEVEETAAVAEANGQSVEKIKASLEDKIEEWKEQNEKYKEFQFELVLNSENTYVLTYVNGGSNRQESWLKDAGFPMK